MQVKELQSVLSFDKVVIHSLAPNLYQVSVMMDGEEVFLLDGKDRFLTSHNKQDLQDLFKDKQVGAMVLRHQSAYDEMLGQPIRESTNCLEVPIGNLSH